MGIRINRNLYKQKNKILGYLKNEAKKSYNKIITIHGKKSDYKQRADKINKAIIDTRQDIISIILEKSTAESWSNDEILNNILQVTYCSYITMIEYRNIAWPYDYMTFSRRIGELWEPFCKNCFEFPVRNDIELIKPPLFLDVKKKLQQEIKHYIERLNLTAPETDQLIDYYDKVWGLLTSGEINLELDLHFRVNNKDYHVDFKSGFQSNEKGNTNRLLLVASIYKNIIGKNNECFLFVRAQEEDNNQYLKTLKNSGRWNVYCGRETYDQIKTYSGFDLAAWIDLNIKWQEDLDKKTLAYFDQKDLVKYLSW
jgi:hypothetical protein